MRGKVEIEAMLERVKNSIRHKEAAVAGWKNMPKGKGFSYTELDLNLLRLQASVLEWALKRREDWRGVGVHG